MVKQKILKKSYPRVLYDLCQGKKYQDKREEKLFAFTNHPNDYKQLFNRLDEEASTRLNSRSARELIVPIPHEFGSDQKKIKGFLQSFMLKAGIDYTKKSTLFICAVHQKLNEEGKLNSHAHLLFSERPILDKPITKHLRERYINEEGRQCKKAEAIGLLPSCDKKVYFGNKYKDSENPQIEYFNSRDFPVICDMAWNDAAKEFGLSPKSLAQIHSKPRKLKKTFYQKEKVLYEKGIEKPLKRAIKREIFVSKVKHSQGLDLSDIWKEIKQEDIESRINEIWRQVKDHEKTYEEAEEEQKELELEL